MLNLNNQSTTIFLIDLNPFKTVQPQMNPETLSWGLAYSENNDLQRICLILNIVQPSMNLETQSWGQPQSEKMTNPQWSRN